MTIALPGDNPLIPLAGAFVAMCLGLLAGFNPLVASGLAVGFAFMLIAVADLAAGLAAFGVLGILTQIPTALGPAVSFSKIAGLWLAVAWLAVIATRREKRFAFWEEHPAMAWVMVSLIIWAFVSVLWAQESDAQAREAAGRYLLNISLLWIAFTALQERKHLVWVMSAFILGGVVSAMFGILNPPEDSIRVSGTFGSANELASVLVVSLMFAVGLSVLATRRALKILALVAAGICIMGIVLTLSRGGMVGLAAALFAAYLFGGSPRLPIAIGAILIVLATVGYTVGFAPPEQRERLTQNDGGTGRTDLWTVGGRMIEDEPIIGIGAGNFSRSGKNYALTEPGLLRRSDLITGDGKTAHNMYIEVFAELGIIGFSLFMTIILFSLRCYALAIRLFRRINDRRMEILTIALFAALAGMLATAMFGSYEFKKELWLQLALAPPIYAMARRSVREHEQAGLPAG